MTAAPRATNRIVELLASPNHMVGFRSATWLAAVGAGLTPPTPGSGVNVNINNQSIGYILDLREGGGGPIDEAALRTIGPAGGVLLDDEPVDDEPART